MENSFEPDLSSPVAGGDSVQVKPGPISAAKCRGRILIVDDDSNSTHLVKVLLERSGPYQIVEENDATAAHETARRFKPDLILLDVAMPKLDGAELLAQLQSDRDLHDTPIIFLTALVTTDEAKSGVHIEGRAAVAKPVNIPELIDAIEKHLPVRAEC